MPRIAINGLGRIGRASLKVIAEIDQIELVAVNDIVSPENLAYLVKYDTVYGRYAKDVVATKDALTIDGRQVPVYGEADPARLPWKELGVERRELRAMLAALVPVEASGISGAVSTIPATSNPASSSALSVISAWLIVPSRSDPTSSAAAMMATRGPGS